MTRSDIAVLWGARIAFFGILFTFVAARLHG